MDTDANKLQMTLAEWLDLCQSDSSFAASCDVELSDRSPQKSQFGYAWSERVVRADKPTGEFLRNDAPWCLPTWIFRHLVGHRKVNYSKSRIYKTQEAAMVAMKDACKKYANEKKKSVITVVI